jgi:hypothetical protein
MKLRKDCRATNYDMENGLSLLVLQTLKVNMRIFINNFMQPR